MRAAAIDVPERIPPCNLEAERALLGAMLLEGASAITTIAALVATTDFYTEANRTIYDAGLDLAAGGTPIDVITMRTVLAQRGQLTEVGGPTYLAQLVEEASVAAHWKTYAGIIREQAVLRGLIQESTRLIGEAFEAKGDTLGLLDRSRQVLERLAARAAPATVESLLPVRSFAEILVADIPPVTFHIEGRVPRRGLTFLVGDSEAYKSWWAKYLGLCKAAGTPVLGQIPVSQGAVLYISEENGEVEDKRRCDQLQRGMGFETGLPFYIASETSFNFDDPARYAALRAIVAERSIDWIIVDSFIRVHRREEKEAGAMNAIYMDRMKPLIKAGVDLLLLHHKRKLPAGMHGAAPASDSDEIRGSGDLRAAAHAVVFLKTLTDSTVVVKQNKLRGCRKPEDFVFSLKDSDQGGVVLTHEGKPKDVLDKTDAAAAAILEYAAGHIPGFYRTDAVIALKKDQGFGRKVVDAALKKLSEKGYPLKLDHHQIGRTKRAFYELVSVDSEELPTTIGEPDDVPF